MKPIQHILIGGSDAREDRRMIAAVYLKRGVLAYREKLQRAWDRGFRRCNMHLPYGMLPGRDMPFDGWWDCNHANRYGPHKGLFDEVLDNDAIGDEIRGWIEKGMRVSRYHGTMRHDDDFVGRPLTDAARTWYRIYMALRADLKMGCEIGLDVSYDAQPGDLVYGVMMMHAGTGTPYFVEPAPLKSNKYVHAPAIMVMERWEHMQTGRSDYRFTSETCVILRDGWPKLQGKDAVPYVVEQFDRVVAAGHTPMVPANVPARVSDDGTILESE